MRNSETILYARSGIAHETLQLRLTWRINIPHKLILFMEKKAFMTLLTLQDAFMKITNIDSVEKDTKKKKSICLSILTMCPWNILKNTIKSFHSTSYHIAIQKCIDVLPTGLSRIHIYNHFIDSYLKICIEHLGRDCHSKYS